MLIFIFGTVDIDDVHCGIALLIVTTYQFTLHYMYLFVQYFGIFYVIVSRYMVLILTMHVRMNQHIIEKCFVFYGSCKI